MQVSVNQRCVDNALTRFSDSIIPSDVYIEEGVKVAHQVFELLKQKSQYKLDRVVFGGSIGKNTDIAFSDFDCVVFINDEEPQFEKILDEFDQILELNSGFLKIQENSIETSRWSVQFKSKNGFSIDLLPAANLVKGLGLGGKDQIERQMEEGVEIIRNNGGTTEFSKMYSSSLAEAQVQFMKDQDSFTHQLVRLAKFWYKSLYFGEYISGAKTIMELIAFAAIQDENPHSKTMNQSFQRFLQYVGNIRNLRLDFEQRNGKWVKTPYPRISNLNRTSSYFIIEPANPFNNLAANLSPKVITKFEQYSKVTLMRYANFKQSVVHHDSDSAFGELFNPQPSQLITTFAFPAPTTHLCGVENSNILNPDMKIHNEKLESKDFTGLLDAYKSYIITTVNSAVGVNSGITASEVQDQVTKMIDENISGTQHKWIQANKRHEEYDVTFTVPFTTASQNGKSNYVIRLSFSL